MGPIPVGSRLLLLHTRDQLAPTSVASGVGIFFRMCIRFLRVINEREERVFGHSLFHLVLAKEAELHLFFALDYVIREKLQDALLGPLISGARQGHGLADHTP